MKRRASIFLTAIVFLAGCSGAGMKETALPTRIDYQCANSRVLQVQRVPEKRLAAVKMDDKVLMLPRADSAAQEKYSDGRYTLYLQGERAALEDNGRVLFARCNAGALPKRTTDGFNRE